MICRGIYPRTGMRATIFNSFVDMPHNIPIPLRKNDLFFVTITGSCILSNKTENKTDKFIDGTSIHNCN